MQSITARWVKVVPTAAILFGSCGGGASNVASTGEDCPEIIQSEAGVYPRTSYVTYFLNGEIVVANQRQVHWNSHSAEVLDTVPSKLDSLDPSQIEQVEVLKPSDVSIEGVCPGVAAVLITTKPGAE